MMSQAKLVWHFTDPTKKPVGFSHAKPYSVAYCGVYFMPGTREANWKSCDKCVKKVAKLSDKDWQGRWLKSNEATQVSEGAQAKLKPTFLEVFKFFANRTSVGRIKLKRVSVFKFAPPKQLVLER